MKRRAKNYLFSTRTVTQHRRIRILGTAVKSIMMVILGNTTLIVIEGGPDTENVNHEAIFLNLFKKS